jgi:chromosome segregation ATPase
MENQANLIPLVEKIVKCESAIESLKASIEVLNAERKERKQRDREEVSQRAINEALSKKSKETEAQMEEALKRMEEMQGQLNSLQSANQELEKKNEELFKIIEEE